jgi:hypothetical protein
MSKISFSILAVSLFLTCQIQAYESNGNHLSCNTLAIFDQDKTKITFYGDSRMDLVDGGFLNLYGFNTMHGILNIQADGNLYPDGEKFDEKNVQNFGVSGFTSRNILDHLIACLNSKNPNYKVGKRFVYHAGGNNFRNAAALSMFMIDKGKGHPLLPLALAFVFELTKQHVRAESDAIVGILKNYASETNPGKKDILVVGGYTPGFWYTPLPSDGAHITPGVSNPAGEKKGELGALQIFLNFTLYIAIGLYQMEHDYHAVATNQRVHHLSVWNEMFDVAYISPNMIHPNEAGFKKWGSLVGKKLREINFHTAKKSVRFTPTGNRWVDTEVQLRLAKEELEEKLAEYNKKKDELELREKKLKEIQDQIRDVEYKLSLIHQRIEKVDGQIKDTKEKIANLDTQIEEARLQGKLEQERILAELKKQEEEKLRKLEEETIRAEQERIERERQAQILAIQRAEAERLAEIARQEAQAAYQAYLDAQERERQAQAAADAAQRERDQLILLAACFVFGICK